jgi:phosphoribosyl 1,2-cyclic phosphodiesterase
MPHEVTEPEVVHESFTVSGGTMDVVGEAVKVTILTGVGRTQEAEHWAWVTDVGVEAKPHVYVAALQT